MYLDKFQTVQNNGPYKNKNKIKKKKRERETKTLKFDILIKGVISNVWVVLGRLIGGIIFNVNILRAHLEERACSSTKVELNGAKVNFREVFHSVHAKIFKASCVVSV